MLFLGGPGRRATAGSSGVLADGPATLGEIPLAGFDRRAFELGRHRVVEAVEETEQCDHRDDVDDLRLAIMLLELFFFQAEDGIRDYKVTGVQTCALPI